MGKVIDIVNQLVEPFVKTQGLELVDVEYVKEGENWILRVFIERPEGEVDLGDCEKVSKFLSERLDTDDPIKESYILEVSSPGLERPLKKLSDYDRFINEMVTIKTYGPINGEKEFTGILTSRQGEEIKIKKKEGEELIVPFKKIASAHLTVDFS